MAEGSAMSHREGGVWEFLHAVEPARRREQGLALREIFDEVTGAEPAMWGPTIVGYGRLQYTYASGRSGEMPRVGFSPRKASLVLYGITLYGTNSDLLERLGKHKVGKGCLYINKLEDIDLDVLREGIARGWSGSDDLFEGTHPGASVDPLDGRS